MFFPMEPILLSLARFLSNVRSSGWVYELCWTLFCCRFHLRIELPLLEWHWSEWYNSIFLRVFFQSLWVLTIGFFISRTSRYHWGIFLVLLAVRRTLRTAGRSCELWGVCVPTFLMEGSLDCLRRWLNSIMLSFYQIENQMYNNQNRYNIID